MSDAHPFGAYLPQLHLTESMAQNRPRRFENAIPVPAQAQTELVINVIDEQSILEPADRSRRLDVDQITRSHGRADHLPVRAGLLPPSIGYGDSGAPIQVYGGHQGDTLALGVGFERPRHRLDHARCRPAVLVESGEPAKALLKGELQSFVERMGNA